MNVAKVLLVDGDAQVRRTLRSVLIGSGYMVVEARDGEEALQELEAQDIFDIVLLDLKMPRLSGFDVCARIRRMSSVPIVVITALHTQEDKLRAFNAGADDYVVKPFGCLELLARIRALRRRRGDNVPARKFESGELQIDFELGQVLLNSAPVCLTPKELGLLQLLVRHEGRPVSHHELLRTLWGPESMHKVELLRVTIRQLREKLATPGPTRYIHTEHCFGYRFESITEIHRSEPDTLVHCVD